MSYHEEEELEAGESQEMSEATEEAESAELSADDLEKVAGGDTTRARFERDTELYRTPTA